MDELKPIIFILLLGNIACLVYHIIMISKGQDNFGSLIFTCIAISACIFGLTREDF